ncbi:extensin [Iris pallida]|uniref:Extensin n=1 Tax=Iris pallida TaxID=29817 RepID=A0AAX6E4Z5_IRIPA|nr:extensin [Iris pallida]
MEMLGSAVDLALTRRVGVRRTVIDADEVLTLGRLYAGSFGDGRWVTTLGAVVRFEERGSVQAWRLEEVVLAGGRSDLAIEAGSDRAALDLVGSDRHCGRRRYGGARRWLDLGGSVLEARPRLWSRVPGTRQIRPRQHCARGTEITTHEAERWARSRRRCSRYVVVVVVIFGGGGLGLTGRSRWMDGHDCFWFG